MCTGPEKKTQAIINNTNVLAVTHTSAIIYLKKPKGETAAIPHHEKTTST
jgi:hypothetical protein